MRRYGMLNPLLFHIFVSTIDYIFADESGCTFTVSQHTPDYALMLKNQPTPELLRPTEGNVFKMNEGDKFKISCVDKSFENVPNSREITVTCEGGYNIRIPYYTYQIRMKLWHLDCVTYPTITHRRTGTACDNRRGEIIELGYTTEGGFLKLYHVCYDSVDEKTIYGVCPYERTSQYGDRRSIISDTQTVDNFFHFPADIYIKVSKQIDTLKKLLLPGSIIDPYVFDSNSFVRDRITFDGYSLIRVCHFVLKAEQLAVDHILNKIPMWKIIHQFEWNQFNHAFYRHLNSQPHRYTVAAGGYQVATLPNAYGVPTELYLYVDDDGHRYLPVPKYVWKIAYDTETATGTAFVIINHPFLEEHQIESLIFCKNIRHQIDWIHFDKEYYPHLKQLFCCDMRDFFERTGIENMFENSSS